MIRMVKMDQRSNWYLLLMIRLYENGDPPLESMRTANLASFVFQEAEERIPS